MKEWIEKAKQYRDDAYEKYGKKKVIFAAVFVAIVILGLLTG